MSIEKKIFALNFYTAGNDLSKRWFVRIKVPNYTKGCLSWKKCYGDINKFNSVDERLKACKELALEIETTQDYKATQGSRKPGYVNENFYTSTIFQFKKQLAARAYRIRLSSKRRYNGLVKNLEAWLLQGGRPQLPIGAFSNNDAQSFLQFVVQGLQQSNESHNQHLRLFKSFFVELILQGVVNKNPFAGIRGMEKINIPALYFNKGQIEILKLVIPNRDTQLWQFCNVMYYCFIRPGELRQLLISDIDFQEARIRMRPEITKNKKLQYVSIPSQLFRMFQDAGFNKYSKNYYLFGRDGLPGLVQLSTSSMKVRHQTILRGIKFSTEHKLYSWKHTGAIACARAGMPLKDLQMQLRHSSLDQVNKYLASMLVWESDFIKNSYPEL
ncbi:MAG: tyrosine-type recombinase/integrase [Ferruginibacter sp.]